MSLYGAVRSHSFEEFLSAYNSEHANDRTGTDSTPLLDALGNTEPSVRIQIANRLLDDGADGAAQRRDGINGLHVLFGARSHDFEPEAALVRRLLSCGADVNAVGGKRGRPLYVLIGNFAILDGEYAPFYDILFSLGDLDLTSPQGRLRSIVELVDKYEKYRPDVVRRVHEYVRTQEGA